MKVRIRAPTRCLMELSDEVAHWRSALSVAGEVSVPCARVSGGEGASTANAHEPAGIWKRIAFTYLKTIRNSGAACAAEAQSAFQREAKQ